jgi:Mrp family chromosome partitioning ATPase
VISARGGLNEALQPVPDIPGLKVLAVNAVPANAADLLAGPAIHNIIAGLRQAFEYVIIDSPPAIPFSDARSLASLADGVILVSRYAQTTRRAMTRTAELFGEVNAPLLGVVLNDMDFSSPDYQYFNYGYTWGGSNKNYYATRRLSDASMASNSDQSSQAKGAHA